MRDRLEPFLNAGLLHGIPNPLQILQGTLEMTPYVLSPDVTAERFYRDSFWARPAVRQPFLLRHIGLDHFATGSGLRSKLSSVCRHLQLTWHEGMPVFDLQLIQTHPDGLGSLRRTTQALIDGDPETAHIRRTGEQLFPDADAYWRRFVEPGGWIDRAAALDYPSPEDDGCELPYEFYSLVSFLNYCNSFPERLADVGYAGVPGHFIKRATRRWRNEGGTGWFTTDRVIAG